MCFTAVADIAAQKCNITAPGIITVKLANYLWIDAFPALDDYPTTGSPNTISGDITLDTTTFSTAGWATLSLTPKRNNLNQEQQDADGLKYYSSSFVGVLAGNDPLVHHWLDQYSRSGLVIQIPDSAGQFMIMGNKTNPAELIWKFDIGAQAGDFVGAELTVNWDAHGAPMPFYTGTDL